MSMMFNESLLPFMEVYLSLAMQLNFYEGY